MGTLFVTVFHGATANFPIGPHFLESKTMFHKQTITISSLLIVVGSCVWGLHDQPQQGGSTKPKQIASATQQQDPQARATRDEIPVAVSPSKKLGDGISQQAPPGSQGHLVIADPEAPTVDSSGNTSGHEFQPVPELLALHLPHLLRPHVGRVVVKTVEGTPGLLGRLQKGDIILRIDGVQLLADEQLALLTHERPHELHIVRRGILQSIRSQASQAAAEPIHSNDIAQHNYHAHSSISSVVIGDTSVICRALGAGNEVEVTVSRNAQAEPQVLRGTREDILSRMDVSDQNLMTAIRSALNGESVAIPAAIEHLFPQMSASRASFDDDLLSEIFQRLNTTVKQSTGEQR
jgi:hypothetical protein